MERYFDFYHWMLDERSLRLVSMRRDVRDDAQHRNWQGYDFPQGSKASNLGNEVTVQRL